MTTKKVKAGGEVTVNASEHTPTPWEIRPRADQTPTAYVFAKGLDTQVGYIGLMSSPENAAHIVKCVNLHDELLEALKEAREALRKTHEADGGCGYQWSIQAMENADRATSKAEGGK